MDDKLILVSSDENLIKQAREWAEQKGLEFTQKAPAESAEEQGAALEAANNVVPISEGLVLPSGRRDCDLSLKSFDDVQKEAVQKALNVSKGNISQVSKILNIGRATVYRKIRQYQIDRPKPLPNKKAA